MKSGPRELAAYHQHVLDEEEKKMHSSTSFEVEKLDAETFTEATERVKKITGSSVAPTTPTPEPIKPERKRRQRADAGQPRKVKSPFAVAIELDLSTDDGRQSFVTMLAAWIGKGEMTKAVHAIESLVKKAQKA